MHPRPAARFLIFAHILSVPFGIDKTSGKVGLVKDVGDSALDYYKLKVTAEALDDGSKVTTEIEVTVLPNGDASSTSRPSQQDEVNLKPSRSYHFTVKENVKDALVANLSELEFGQQVGKEIVKDVLILNSGGSDSEAREKFGITEQGLLFTKAPLDRETAARHSLLLGKGRGGVLQLRGNGQVVQVIVEVADENDNSPAFDRHIYQGSVRQSDLEAGRAVQVDLGHRIRVSDPDLGDEIALKVN